MLWRGDFQNARQLLRALARRAHRSDARQWSGIGERAAASPAEVFNLHRMTRARRARTLAMLLLPFAADHRVELPRAPDVREACAQVHGPGNGPYVASLRELLGLISAYEWRRTGVEIPALDARIHPHYGVFSPVRNEYVDLVFHAPLPAALAPRSTQRAFDIGTGTGVLAAVLARRGVERIVATDNDRRALACARENVARLGVAARVDVVQSDLYPEGRAALAVCNPPWVPARPSSPLERGIYDPDSRMLRGFLDGLAAHLIPGGEGWLILSDLAEHLGLRTRAWLLAAMEAAQLKILGRTEITPWHPRSADRTDPLHAARRAERTSLWRLATA